MDVQRRGARRRLKRSEITQGTGDSDTPKVASAARRLGVSIRLRPILCRVHATGSPAVQVARKITAQPAVADLKPSVGATGAAPLPLCGPALERPFHFEGRPFFVRGRF